ncbi:alcohol oxidase [Amylostereum chailletii]|nr:alcohol oxidase [Amylostereum chailletii]
MLVKNLDKVGKRVQPDGNTATDGGDLDLYDVVIVGGGTAGCVLASRLTEDSSVRVLVLESGKSSLTNTLSQIPLGFVLLWGSKSVYDLYTTPQANTDDRKFYWPRGRMLGGYVNVPNIIVQHPRSTLKCCFFMALYHYGAPSDYDEWARIAGPGGESWGYSTLTKYFKKFEKFNPSEAHPDVDVTHRGSAGPVNVGFYGNHSEITERFIKSCEEIGIPRVSDLNTSKGSIGVAKTHSVSPLKFMTYIDAKGHRVTTESAYLTPDVLKRPNLTVAIGASVTRLLFDKSEDGEPRATGIEFTASAKGPRFRVRAKKEVLMCAGAVHTPHIMLLSGLGPAVELEQHNIPVVVDLPGVGKHLMDHPVVDVSYRETGGHSLIMLRPRTIGEAVRSIPHLLRYFLFGTGPMTCNVCEAAAFFRSTDTKLFAGEGQGQAPEDATSGSEAPDLEMLVSPLGYAEHGKNPMPQGNSMGLHMCLLRPKSLGSITLKSSDPFEAPVIDPNYLSNPNDLAVLQRGLRLLTRTSLAPPLASILDHKDEDPRFGNALASASDEALTAYIKENVQTLYHPTSTTRMAPKEDGGVVDVRLKVYGVKGLRVVDAGAFPTIVSGHTP